MTIHVVMSDNICNKLCQLKLNDIDKLKLNDIDCYVNCHTKFNVKFGTQFTLSSIIIFSLGKFARETSGEFGLKATSRHLDLVYHIFL